MKRPLTYCVAGLIACLAVWQLQGQTPAEKQLQPYMQMKLDHAKTLLEGLAMEDFDKISASAQKLSLLSNESSWNVITTEKYLSMSDDFRRAAAMIKKGAEEENIDRATLGYVDLTMRCVDCHSYLRDMKKKAGQ